MNVLSLFSGIGLHDLGIERAGMRTVAFCEADSFCRAVLAKHWPEVPCFDDVRTLSASALRSAGIGRIDLITGGFPCQPHSVAGARKGVKDPRHLWPEYARLVREIRPAWVLAENVPGLRTTAADLVLDDLAEAGYAAWPLVVGADDVGAPHRRKRVWIVAYLARDRDGGESENAGADRLRTWPSGDEALAHRDGAGLHRLGSRGLLDRERQARGHDVDRRGERAVGKFDESRTDAYPANGGSRNPVGESGRSMGDACGDGLEERSEPEEQRGHLRDTRATASKDGDRARWPARPGEPQHEWEPSRLTFSRLGRGSYGSASRLDSFVRRNRLKALGNGNPPQVVEAIGRAILAADQAMRVSIDGE